MEKRLKNVCEFYAITHKLKNTLRQGTVLWKVNTQRIDSVAEHIFGTQMLAFAIDSEFNLDLDILKVALMLAVHELGETIIGDITMLDNISKKEKHEMEMKAVFDILEPMSNKEKIKELYLEFEDNQTKESKFAHMVDKLECDFQIKYFEENGCNDFTTPRTGIFEELRQERIASGWKTLAKAWIEYDKENCGYDDLFKSIADYLADNEIFKIKNGDIKS